MPSMSVKSNLPATILSL